MPALLLPGLTLVVSPLIALMKDQIDFLVSRGVQAARFDSSLDAKELAEVRERQRSGQLKLLYVSPERLSNERFVASLRNTKISLMVVDEAHCISEWGHNFRPDYLKLVQAAQRLQAGGVLALTATATPKVGQDICRAFAIARANWFQDSFHRSNLELHMSPCTDRQRLELLLSRLQERPAGATIVYVTLQRTAEWLARSLSEKGYAAEAYHAGMEGDIRHAIQDRFMAAKDRIVVATIAFGMGIDKADIQRLQQVIGLAEHRDCRVIALLKYFGETLDSDSCGHCDTCLGRPVQALSVLEQMTLNAVQCEQIDKLAQEKHPALAHPRQMARFLCGLNSPATTRDRLTKHEAFGSLEQIPFHDILDACEMKH